MMNGFYWSWITRQRWLSYIDFIPPDVTCHLVIIDWSCGNLRNEPGILHSALRKKFIEKSLIDVKFTFPKTILHEFYPLRLEFFRTSEFLLHSPRSHIIFLNLSNNKQKERKIQIEVVQRNLFTSEIFEWFGQACWDTEKIQAEIELGYSKATSMEVPYFFSWWGIISVKNLLGNMWHSLTTDFGKVGIWPKVHLVINRSYSFFKRFHSLKTDVHHIFWKRRNLAQNTCKTCTINFLHLLRTHFSYKFIFSWGLSFRVYVYHVIRKVGDYSQIRLHLLVHLYLGPVKISSIHLVIKASHHSYIYISRKNVKIGTPLNPPILGSCFSKALYKWNKIFPHGLDVLQMMETGTTFLAVCCCCLVGETFMGNQKQKTLVTEILMILEMSLPKNLKEPSIKSFSSAEHICISIHTNTTSANDSIEFLAMNVPSIIALHTTLSFNISLHIPLLALVSHNLLSSYHFSLVPTELNFSSKLLHLPTQHLLALSLSNCYTVSASIITCCSQSNMTEFFVVIFSSPDYVLPIPHFLLSTIICSPQQQYQIVRVLQCHHTPCCHLINSTIYTTTSMIDCFQEKSHKGIRNTAGTTTNKTDIFGLFFSKNNKHIRK
ncbi:hypothetical protein VP01_17g6 [Puccinia sorghi]|uniref:Uncharacterized protein n=1 Tax=Puccinia sorghi TaxID=27349 RepID=A0A0L6VEE7_9BASI|nr:hypothetical protein VP01_17g6 [Puccinia sorghi]